MKKEEGCPLCEMTNEALERQSQQKTKKKPQKNLRLILVLLIIGLVIGTFYFLKGDKSSAKTNITSAEENAETSSAIQIGALAPDFTSEDTFGNKYSLSQFKNEKPVLLVFWATWCSYCAKELPDLIDFTQKHGDEIQVITIPSGETKSTVADYIQKNNINFPMVLDEKKDIWNTYLVRGTPNHILIDKEGRVVTLYPGLASLRNLEVMLTMLPKP